MAENEYKVYSLLFGPNQPDKSISMEPMGSKKKFWFTMKIMPESPWLFKFARLGTGEHWAEKIASELAKVLEIPAQRAELAVLPESGNEKGVIVQSIIPSKIYPGSSQPVNLGVMVHGNEFLAGRIPEYEKTKVRKQLDHSWTNIRNSLRFIYRFKDHYVECMKDFASLLVLDALIVNTDRHHENWAVLFHREKKLAAISPSFDHASSLGRELSDAKRNELIRKGSVSMYVDKACGAIYGASKSKNADNPIDLVAWANKENPEWFEPWLERVERLDRSMYVDIIDRVPDSIMSEPAKLFAKAILDYSTKRLKELRG